MQKRNRPVCICAVIVKGEYFVRIEQLAYLVETAKHQTLTAAAEALHLTPQSLGRSISNLEQEIGVTLLIRTPYGITLAEPAHAVINSAAKILQEYEKIMALNTTAGPTGETVNGKITLIALDIFNASLLPHILARFNRIQPSIKIAVLTVATNDDLVKYGQMLADNSIHENSLCLIPAAEGCFTEKAAQWRKKGCALHPFYQGRYKVFASEGSALAKQKSVSAGRLLQYPIVRLASVDVDEDAPLNQFLAKYGTPTISFSTSSLDIWLEAINNGVGIGVANDMLISQYSAAKARIQNANIRILSIKENESRSYSWLYKQMPTKVVQEFLRCFDEITVD